MCKLVYLLLLLLQEIIINAELKCKTKFHIKLNGRYENQVLCKYEMVNDPHKFNLKPTLNHNSNNRYENNIQTIINSSIIPKLQHDTFTNTDTINNLEIVNSNISEINSDAFDGFVALKVLKLANTTLSILKNSTFTSLDSLLELVLPNNSINSIETGAFMRLYQLEKIDLSFNRISKINEVFNSLLSLKYLDLSHNNFTTLEKFLFHDMKILEELYLSNNKIVTVEKAAFSDLNKLKYLDLSKNNIIKIWSIGNLTALRDLKLQENFLTSINTGTFSGLLNLEHLNLSENHINTISGFPFHNTPNIKVLDLSKNELKSFDPSDISHADSLDLRGNPLICSSLVDLLRKLSNMRPRLIKGNIYGEISIHGIPCQESEGIFSETRKYISDELVETFKKFTNTTLFNNKKMLELLLRLEKKVSSPKLEEMMDAEIKSRNDVYIFCVLIVILLVIFIIVYIFIKYQNHAMKLVGKISGKTNFDELIPIS